eukprot:7158590-Ditylum_brightwellii.AAC.1
MGFPFNKEILGHVLGPTKGKYNRIAQWMLKCNGNVVPQYSLTQLNESEIHSEREIKKYKFFDNMIEKRWELLMNPSNLNTHNNQDHYEDDDEIERSLPE